MADNDVNVTEVVQAPEIETKDTAPETETKDEALNESEDVVACVEDSEEPKDAVPAAQSEDAPMDASEESKDAVPAAQSEDALMDVSEESKDAVPAASSEDAPMDASEQSMTAALVEESEKVPMEISDESRDVAQVDAASVEVSMEASEESRDAPDAELQCAKDTEKEDDAAESSKEEAEPSQEEAPEVEETKDVEELREKLKETEAIPIVTDFSTPVKKPTPSFFLFSMDARSVVVEELKQKNGGKATPGEIAKETSDRWSKLTDPERKVYEDKSAAQKQRYDAYLEASDPLVALRIKYQDLIPKKPQPAYMIFQHDVANREKAAQLLEADGKPANHRNVTSKVQEMWKTASVEERAQVQEKALKMQIEFLSKHTAWQATPEFEELQQAERVHEAGKRSVLQTKSKKSVKVAPKSKAKAATKKTGKDVKQQSKGAPSTPSKRSRGSAVITPVSDAKKSRKSTGKELGPYIDEKVLAKAQKLGLDEALKNLAARPEVVSSGKSTQKILDALQSKGGLVNAAKHVLLGR